MSPDNFCYDENRTKLLIVHAGEGRKKFEYLLAIPEKEISAVIDALNSEWIT